MRGSALSLAQCRHVWHVDMKYSISVPIFGHQTDCRAFARHFSIDRCPACKAVSVSCRSEEGTTILELYKIRLSSTVSRSRECQYDLRSRERSLTLGQEVAQYVIACCKVTSAAVAEITLLTSNPEKVKAVRDSGITCHQMALAIEPNEFNQKYLATKAERLGHNSSHQLGGK